MTEDITVLPAACTATTAEGKPCRARPITATALCAYHTKSPELKAAHSRGGQLAQARRALVHARADALAKIGANAGALLPSLDSIDTMTAFLADLVKKTADRSYSPPQAMAMIAALRLGKDLLSLGLEVRLLEEMEKTERGEQ